MDRNRGAELYLKLRNQLAGKQIQYGRIRSELGKVEKKSVSLRKELRDQLEQLQNEIACAEEALENAIATAGALSRMVIVLGSLGCGKQDITGPWGKFVAGQDLRVHGSLRKAFESFFERLMGEHPDTSKEEIESEFDRLNALTSQEYEQFVEELIRQLSFCQNSEVYRNHRFPGIRQPGKYEIDIAVKFMFDNTIEFFLIVECKNWKRPVGRPVVQKLANTRDAIAAHKAAIVSPIGFTQEAIEVAKAYGVALWVISEEQWTTVCFEGGADPLDYQAAIDSKIRDYTLLLNRLDLRLPKSSVYELYPGKHIMLVDASNTITRKNARLRPLPCIGFIHERQCMDLPSVAQTDFIYSGSAILQLAHEIAFRLSTTELYLDLSPEDAIREFRDKW